MHIHDHGNMVAEHLFEHIFSHTLADTWTLIPFMFVVFLILEYLEHSISGKSLDLIKRSGKTGPLLGGVVGALPQCGFSVMATNLYAGGIISMGTIVAVYLSTSDEMLAVMLGSNMPVNNVLTVILFKILVGVAAGFAVDIIGRLWTQHHIEKHHHSDSHHHHDHNHIDDFCQEEDCHCSNENPFTAAAKHTVKIFAVIFVVTFLLNLVIDLAGVEVIEKTVSKAGVWAPVVAGVVGMIPNCASSVAITQLYISGAISFGTAMSGLLCGSGIAWIVLFRVNPHSRQNFKIMGIVYFTGVATGIVMNIMGIAI